MKKKYFLTILVLAAVVLILKPKNTSSLYELKTDISNENEVQKLVSGFDWKDYKIQEIKIEDEKVLISFEGESKEFKDEDFKTLVKNAISILVLAENSKSVEYLKDISILNIDRGFANIVVTQNIGKNLDYFSKDEKTFNELYQKLETIKYKGMN